jgi:hypothetical protein
LIPSEERPPFGGELARVVLYHVAGATVGCLFVVASNLLAHSLNSALILFVAAAVPVWLGSSIYLRYTIKRFKNKKTLPNRPLIYLSVLRGFSFGTIPTMFLIYVYLNLIGYA